MSICQDQQLQGNCANVNDYAERLTNAVRKLDHPNRRPSDAATLIVIDHSAGKPLVLMGKRHERHAFLPGKFVFPGGRVDVGDSRLAVSERLNPAVEKKLLVDMKGAPSVGRAKAMALAAIRETYEETGLLIGSSSTATIASRSPAWRPFAEQNIVPALSSLSFFCRAITPPRRPRRYDTRFFCISSDHIAHRTKPTNSELIDLHWLTFKQALDLDLPIITRVVLEELQEKLENGAFPQPDTPVPYYYMRNGIFHRELV